MKASDARPVTIRPFTWDDLRSLYDAMRRAGAAPYVFADNPLAALEADLRRPRIEATGDVFVADSGDRLVGWIRVDLEPDISRAVATPGVDPEADDRTLQANLLRQAMERAGRAGADVLHVPVGEGDDCLTMAARSLGLRPVRVHEDMEWHPVPAHPPGDNPPVPDGFAIRTMAVQGEEGALADLQNAAFAGSWGFSPNDVEDVRAKLALAGYGAGRVAFVIDRADKPVAYAWMRFEPSSKVSAGYIDMIGVHPEHRRAGLGRVIMRTAMQELRDGGAGVIKLEVDQDNEPARALYRDLGFQRVAEKIWYEAELN